MLDLYNKKYSIDELIENIYALPLLDILKTQQLTKDFCINYILNPSYQLLEEEECLTIEDIIYFQPHLKENLDLDKSSHIRLTQSFSF